MENIVGRKEEQTTLNQLLESNKPEFWLYMDEEG